jgi:hypothetical protein
VWASHHLFDWFIHVAHHTRSIFYAGYLAAQLPATYVMKKVPIGKFISGTIISWSIVLTLHAAVTSYEGLLACRFLLGLYVLQDESGHEVLMQPASRLPLLPPLSSLCPCGIDETSKLVECLCSWRPTVLPLSSAPQSHMVFRVSSTPLSSRGGSCTF